MYEKARRENDAVLTSMRRHVASTLIRHQFGTKFPLGRWTHIAQSYQSLIFLLDTLKGKKETDSPVQMRRQNLSIDNTLIDCLFQCV